MSALLAWITARNKAFAALAIGGYNWGAFVTNKTTSPSGPITSGEWMLGFGIVLAALGVHQIANSNVFASQPQQTPTMTVVPSMTYTTSGGTANAPNVVTGGTTPEIPPAA